MHFGHGSSEALRWEGATRNYFCDAVGASHTPWRPVLAGPATRLWSEDTPLGEIAVDDDGEGINDLLF